MANPNCDHCPHCNTVAILTNEDAELIDRASSVLSSDYNDAPHDKIEALRERIKPSQHCGDCGAKILGYHACQGVPGGFGDDDAG